MKKILKFLAIAITLLVSVIFCACSKPYSKLKLEYVSDSSYIQLVLDGEYRTATEQSEFMSLSAVRIQIKFSGIKSSKIGEVDINCEPLDLVSINTVGLESGSLYYDIFGKKVGNGAITITHVASGKQVKIDIYVDKKSYDVETMGNTLVVDIPDAPIVDDEVDDDEGLNADSSQNVANEVQNTEDSSLDSSQEFVDSSQNGSGDEEFVEDNYNYFVVNNSELLNFSPADATDNVIWGLADIENNVLPEGVQIINTLEQEDFISILPEDVLINLFGSNYKSKDLIHKNKTIIKVSSSCEEVRLKLKPKVSMSVGLYEEVDTNDAIIDLLITNVLDADSIKVASDNAVTKNRVEYENNFAGVGQNFIEIKDKISLFYNSATLNTVNIYLCKDGKNIYDTNQTFDISLFKDINDTIETSLMIQKNVVNDGSPNKYFQFTSTAISSYNEQIAIKFEPNNAVGDIKAFTKTIDLKLTEVAESVQVKDDEGNIVAVESVGGTPTADVTILDYYAFKGQLFNFNVLKTTTDASLQNFKIYVNSALLSPSNRTGINLEDTSEENIEKIKSLNKFVFEFSWGRSNEFIFTASDYKTGYYESPTFTKYDNIYVKYASLEEEAAKLGIEELQDIKEFYFDVRNIYDNEDSDNYYGENKELDKSCKTLRMEVNRQKGIKSIDLQGGVLSVPQNGNWTTKYNDEEQVLVLNNLTEYQNNLVSKSYYGMYIGYIKDKNGISLSNGETADIDFYIYAEKDGEIVDCFDFVYYNKGIERDRIQLQEDKKAYFNMDYNDACSYILLFKKDAEAIIENATYKIVLGQVVGDFCQTIDYIVVSNINVDNISLAPFNDGFERMSGVYEGLYYTYRDNENKIVDEFTTLTEFYEEVNANNGGAEVASVQNANVVEKDDKVINSYFVPNNEFSFDTKILIGRTENDKFIEDDNYLSFIKGIEVKTSIVKLGETDFEETEIENVYLYYQENVSNLNSKIFLNGSISTKQKGTIINKTNHYVKVDFVVKTNFYETDNSFYTENIEGKERTLTVYFFVYEDINSYNISNESGVKINELTPYVYKDLGYYFKDYATKKLYLNINNSETKSVFDYIDCIWKQSETLFPKGQTSDLLDGSKEYTFKYANAEGDPRPNNGYITCTINQYGVKRTLSCYVNFQEVNVTKNIAVRNNLSSVQENNQTTKYVYLKQGQDFKFDVVQLGNYTFEGIKYVVCDMAGNIYTEIKFDDNGNLLVKNDSNEWIKPTHKGANQIMAGDYKVLIFSKDWLSKAVDETNVSLAFNFNDLSEYLISGKYHSKVKQIVIKVRDGSKQNPFLVSNKAELKTLNSGYYYEIVNDINMNNEKVNLGDLDCHLSSYSSYIVLTKQPTDWGKGDNYSKYYTYSANNGYTQLESWPQYFRLNTYFEKEQTQFSVYYVKFNDETTNNKEYDSFSFINSITENGSLSNINFTYIINENDLAENKFKNIGLVATNYGTIRNVTVEYTISLEDGVSAQNMGMLVAENRGTIVYDNASLVASTGNATIYPLTAMNIGGLAGKNVGTIEGVLSDDLKIDAGKTGTVDYVVFYEEQGSLFNGNISVNIDKITVTCGNCGNEYLATEKKCTNTECEKDNTNTVLNNVNLGGVVGLNLNTISNVYVSGSLSGYNNVGGIAGLSDTVGMQLRDLKNNENPVINSDYIKDGDRYVVANKTNLNVTYYRLLHVGLGEDVYNGDDLVENGIYKKADELDNDSYQANKYYIESNNNFILSTAPGFNEETTYYELDRTLLAIYNSQSTTKVKGNNNIGGLVGSDNYGIYYHVYYEVYEDGTKVTSVHGNDNIGGLIGSGNVTKLMYSYFHSFNWHYKADVEFGSSEFYTDANDGSNADINGINKVAGLIGNATGGGSDYSYSADKVCIVSSNVDAFIYGEQMVAGAVCSASGVPYAEYGYVQGCIISKYDTNYRSYRNVTSTYDVNDSNHYYFAGLFAYFDSTEKKRVYGKDNTSGGVGDVPNIFGKDENEDAKINNGRPYLLYHGSPLVTQAPISIDLDALTDEHVNGTTGFKVEENGVTKEANLTKTIMLYYYDLINNNSENYANDKTSLNTISLDEFLIRSNIKIMPKKNENDNTANGIGGRFRLSSSNEDVFSIKSDGSIVLKGEGIATLTLTSVITRTVYDSITIIVAGMPTGFNIYSSSLGLDGEELEEINIVKDESKFVYDKFVGSIEYNGTVYNYQLTNNVAVQVFIVDEDGKGLTEKVDNVKINGDSLSSNPIFKSYSTLIMSVDDFVDYGYIVTFNPYVYFELNNTDYYVDVMDEQGNTTEKTINLTTRQGVTNISTNVVNTTMSVADELDLEIELATDTATEQIDVYINVKDQNGNHVDIEKENGIKEKDLFCFGENVLNEQLKLSLSTAKFDKNNQYQLNSFTLRLNEKLRVEKDLFVTMTLYKNGRSTEIKFTLIPQDISSIVASNYKQSNQTNSWEKRQVIRPDEPNMIVIDVAPEYAYFEYLEITDLSTVDRLKFTQFDNFDPSKDGYTGKALSQMDELSSDGFGIKLKKVDGNKSFYVYTLLDIAAQYNMAHRIKITAFSSSGIELGYTVITIESVLFPYVKLTYINAKGAEDITSNSLSEITNNKTDLALGVTAKIKVETRDTDRPLEWTITESNGVNITEEFKKFLVGGEPQLKADGYYYLEYNNSAFNEDKTALSSDFNAFLNKTITLKATAKRQLNGIVESSETELKFTLRALTLNGVSLKTDLVTSGNRLAGVVGAKQKFEIYFDNTDISWFNNGAYWNRTYSVSDTDYGNDAIKTLLKQLNSVVTSTDANTYVQEKYVKLVLYISGEKVNVNWNTSDVTKIEEQGYIEATLTSESGEDYTNYITIRKYINKERKETLDNAGYEIIINTVSMNNAEMGVEIDYYYKKGVPTIYDRDDNIDEISIENTIEHTLPFNISNVSTLFDYIPIATAEEFYDMVEGGYYILVDDITLDNYEVLDINLGGFDGNGHVITINNFDYASLTSTYSDGTAYFGLFKEVYEGSIVKNVQLKYNMASTTNMCEYPISDGVYYSTIYFGGITSTNNGIITNSIVSGDISVITTQISPSKFFVGGVACTNGATGYITNTICDVNILTGGIVGGFVCDNQGTIASSKFTNNLKSYVNTQSGYTDVISLAGFAVYNSGKITLSAVCPNEKDTDGIEFGTGGSIGGFVYENESSAQIFDCYLTGVKFSTSGSLGGFVHTSAGSIMRCYIDARSTNLDGDRTKAVFVRTYGNSKIENCYYVLTNYSASTVAGVSCVSAINVNNASSFDGLIFTDNDNGVWRITSNGPILLNNNLEVKIGTKAEHKETVDGEEITKFIVSGTREIPYVIYNTETYEYYMNMHEDGSLYRYYRIVADIDFGEMGNPISSKYTFSGMLEGNNMTISNFGLFSVENSTTDSLGLFGKIVQNQQGTGFVNNLTISALSVRGTNSSTVGVLAGEIVSGKIYNISIDNPSLVVVGKNSVGGLAGIVKGNYDINGITVNVGARSTYRNAGSKVIVYLGRDVTYNDQSNLSSVSYAGAVVGIIEGYDYRTQMVTVLSNYRTLQNVVVNGSNLIIAETAGGVVGLITKFSHLTNTTLYYDEDTHISAVYNAGGLVGENRGIISKSSMVLSKDVTQEELLTSTYYNVDQSNASVATAGIVAVNYGGLVYDVYNESNVVSYNGLGIAGGIVARNVNGTIVKAKNMGLVYSLVIGGIAGADYSYSTLNSVGNVEGCIDPSGMLVVPDKIVDYSDIKFDTAIQSNAQYQQISLIDLDNWFNIQKAKLSALSRVISDYYFISKTDTNTTHTFLATLGAVVGLTDSNYYQVNVNLTGEEVNQTVNMIDIVLHNATFEKTSIKNGATDYQYDNFFIDNRKLTSTTEGANDSLLERVVDNNTFNGNYYYLIALTNNKNYDTPSLANGYSVGVVRIVK